MDNTEHPTPWTKINHWGQCGQSCPCCRAIVEGVPFGVCSICWDKKMKNKSKN